MGAITAPDNIGAITAPGKKKKGAIAAPDYGCITAL